MTVMMMPAVITPQDMAIIAFFLSMPRTHAAKVAEYAPVNGRGMAVNNASPIHPYFSMCFDAFFFFDSAIFSKIFL